MATQARELGPWALLVLLVGRFTVNTAFRVLYPLLPILVVRMGVDLPTASLAVTVLVGTGLLSPLGGMLGDLRGERFAMLAGLALIALGAAVCALVPAFWPFLGAILLLFVGLGFWANGLVAGALVVAGLTLGVRWLREGSA